VARARGAARLRALGAVSDDGVRRAAVRQGVGRGLGSRNFGASTLEKICARARGDREGRGRARAARGVRGVLEHADSLVWTAEAID
jgi:hypothetical protein